MEKEYVLDSYSKIAKEFDHTRYKAWPSVIKFINSLDSSSSVLDAGCGNGRNMLIRKDLNWIGCDFCPEFVEICRQKDFISIQADIRNLPFKDNEFDHSISIAVIHHISTFEERVKACQELIRVTKGKIFIQVWQCQDQASAKFKRIADNDYFVSWELNDKSTVDRYYHLFDEKEINELLAQLKEIKVIEKYIEAGNWVFLLEKTL